ncbi:hypothetical protein [Pararhizobium sp. LjRoot238]|uniref:hypothetical protein n=1 Tax=Pararhizobium sp. LjRoot238 TaxID=3342293 RepID=UPI003ECD8C1D
MARQDGIAETFRIIKQETIAATKALLVKTAKAEHAKVMAAAPAPSSFVRIVDGRVGATEETAKADGRIVYQYRRMDEVVEFALKTLRDLSPVLSGDYRKGHVMFLNGLPAADLSTFRDGDDLMITNYLPYARKIEVGKMQMRVAGSSKVYQQARRLVMARFGNSVSVEFTYRAVIGGHAVDQTKAPSTGKSWWLGHDGEARAASGVLESAVAKKHGKTAHNKSDVRFPCLVIRER